MAQQAKITAMVLAAGASHRFGAADKLQAHLDNETVLSRSLAAYADAPLVRKIAITRPDKNLAAICAASVSCTSVERPDKNRCASLTDAA